MKRFQTLLVLGAICGLTTVGVDSAWAQKKPNNSAQEKKDDAKVKAEQQDLQRAKQDLEKEEKDLREAQRHLADAQAKVKAAGRAEQDARESAEAKHGRAHGLDKALADQEEARKAYDALATPLLATIKESPVYKTAKARAEAAHEELKKIRANSELSYDEKRRLEASASQRALATTDIERDALNADPKIKPVKEKLDFTLHKVADIRGKIKSLVDQDSAVKSAHANTEKARTEVESAQARVNQESQKVAAARGKLSREAAEVSRAVAADKANDNKGKNTKGKKK